MKTIHKHQYFNKIISPLLLLLSSILLLSSTTALADNKEDDLQLLKIMGMNLKDLLKVEVLSASKHAQTMDQAPSIMSVFTRNDIEKMGVTSMIDILKYAPGIETSMAPNGYWRVDIRGVRKDGNILLMIDGQAFNNFYNGRALFDLPTSLIEKIEIIRGPGSALYGSNAVVGVINVITRHSEQSFSLGLENNKGFQLAYADKISNDDFVLGFNFGYKSTDGANQKENQDFNAITTQNIGETNRYLDELSLNTYYQQNNFDLSFVGLYRKMGPYVGPLFDFAEQTKNTTGQYHLKAQYQYNHDNDLTITPKLHLNITQTDTKNQDIAAGSIIFNNQFTTSGFTHENYSTLLVGTEIQFDYQFNQTTLLIAGLSYDKLKMTDYDLTRNYHVIGFIPESSYANFDQLIFEQDNKQREISALFIQSEFNWDKWLLTLGMRADFYSDFGDSTNPRAALIYQFNEKLKLKILTASAFRAPTFKELYDNTRIGFDGVIGNPQLEAEEIVTHEIGLEYQNSIYILRANIFNNENTNIIDLYDPQGGGAIGHIENTGDLKTYGGATELIFQINDNLQIFLNVSRYKAIFNWSNDPLFDNEREYLANNGQSELFNAPRTRAKLGIDWSSNQWSFFIGANYAAKSSHNNISILQSVRHLLVDDYLQFDTSLRYQYQDNITFKLAANNLGQNKNSDPDGYSNSDQLGFDGLLQPSETYHLSMSYQF